MTKLSTIAGHKVSLYPPPDPKVGDYWVHAYTYVAYRWDGFDWELTDLNVLDTSSIAYDKAMEILR